MTDPRDTQKPLTPIATKECTHGLVIVDACDADLLSVSGTAYNGFNAYAGFSIRVENNRRTRKYLHRAIVERMIGYPLTVKMLVDHIDGDTLNNRRENLRLCTNAENMRNIRTPKHNTSGFKGVSFDRRTGRYLASITVNKVSKNLGRYRTPEEAHAAYLEAARLYFGEFANDGIKNIGGAK